MNLVEIRELLAFKDNPSVNCDWINTLIENHIADVNEQIASLEHLKGHLQKLLHKCSGGKKAECGIIAGLEEAEYCPYCADLRCCSIRQK